MVVVVVVVVVMLGLVLEVEVCWFVGWIARLCLVSGWLGLFWRLEYRM